MGTWGSGLYSNDSTVDVKEIYMQFLQQQFSNEEAYEKTKQDCYEYFGTDIEPLFWYALADTQWELVGLMFGRALGSHTGKAPKEAAIPHAARKNHEKARRVYS